MNHCRTLLLAHWLPPPLSISGSHGIVNGTAVPWPDLQPGQRMCATVLLLLLAGGLGDDACHDLAR